MPVNVKKALLKAAGLARKGDAEGAARLYHAVLADFPGNKQAQQGLRQLGQPAPGGGTAAGDLPQRIERLVALFNGGRLEEALALGRALESSGQPVVHNVVGAACAGLGHFSDAVAAYRRALALMPDYAEGHNNLGAALNRLGSHEEAARSFRRAIELNPRFHEAHNNLGNALKELGQHEQALASFAAAIAIKPDFADAHNNMGSVLSELGRYDECIESCRAALRYRPAFASARARLLHQYARVCDWDAIDAMRTDIAELGLADDAVSPFSMLSLDDDPARQRRRAEVFAERNFARGGKPNLARPASMPERVRIGYFSADFHNHATLHLMAGLLEHHDAQRFSIHLFSYGPDQEDALRHRARQAVDAFHDVRHLGDEAVAAHARAERIDIAVDLKGYTLGARPGIFAHGAAPIQVSYLGYPGTMGVDFIDYLIADDFVIPPEARPHYAEKIVYLPGSYQVNDDCRGIAEASASREAMGLPPAGFVFCCFNNSYKITASEFDIWMRLLQAVPGSVLWLLDAGARAGENLRAHAERRGVSGERLVFAGRAPLPEHLARHCHADLFLDTFNCNAHTTASDALWAGLPLLTLPGRGFAARVAGSLLRAVDLPQLIASSPEDYEHRALALAQDPAELGALRSQLQQVRDTAPLFDTRAFTEHLEAAYQQLLERHTAGLEPADLTISPG